MNSFFFAKITKINENKTTIRIFQTFSLNLQSKTTLYKQQR